MFATADAEFKHLLTTVFGLHFTPQSFWQIVTVLYAAFVFVGVFSTMFIAKTPIPSAKNIKIKRLGITESSIVLGSVSLLFGLFIIVQITYLFGGQNEYYQVP